MNAPGEGDIYEHRNRGLLDTALAPGAKRLHFICLWDGAAGQAGGIADMVAEVQGRGGRVHWIDSRQLAP